MTREEVIAHKVAESIAGDFLSPNDPWGHAQLEIIRRMCVTFDHAMNLEDIHSSTRLQVINRVLFGDPDGLEDLHRRSLEALQKFVTDFKLPDLDEIMRRPQ